MDEFDSCQQRDLELDEDEFVDFWSQFRKLILTFFEILMKNCIFDRVFLVSRSVFYTFLELVNHLFSRYFSGQKIALNLLNRHSSLAPVGIFLHLDPLVKYFN